MELHSRNLLSFSCFLSSLDSFIYILRSPATALDKLGKLTLLYRQAHLVYYGPFPSSVVLALGVQHSLSLAYFPLHRLQYTTVRQYWYSLLPCWTELHHNSLCKTHLLNPSQVSMLVCLEHLAAYFV